MNERIAGIWPCLVSLMLEPGVSLGVIAACADARFSIHVGTVEKKRASDDRMTELAESYDRLTRECLCSAAEFRAHGDVAGLEQSLGRLASQLKAFISD